jgi:predicted AAA+ superfamily ATPase
MKHIPRIYDSVLTEHLAENRQMVFFSGPRQVGKTTASRLAGNVYLDWDNRNHQMTLLKGPEAIAEFCGLHVASAAPPIIVFDELHKFPRWKNLLKGFFDTYEKDCRIVVTGSARMDVYRRGGDSLMGRYFPYRVHPLSVAELLHPDIQEKLIREPSELDHEEWATLRTHGGFPEPFRLRNARFTSRWQTQRNERLFKEDLRDLTRIQEFSLLEILARILADRSGEQLVFSNLAADIQVAPNTVKTWVNTLASTYYGFLVRPWFRNVSKALRKEPKWYLRDWSGISDTGARAETLIACHLLKAVEYWTDTGRGQFELRYVRDKQKREVDFLVVRDEKPWFLVEVKQSDTTLSPSLGYFQKQTGAEHAFQVVIDLPYVQADCFERTTPVVVSAQTFLSQLV